MIPDLDIYRAAKLLFHQLGEDAAIRAAERVDEVLGDGDIEGAAIWRAILAAVAGRLKNPLVPGGCDQPSVTRRRLPRAS
jgi:hypothetical protein